MANRKSTLKRALFLHIQKTAGSTVVDLARFAYGSNNFMSHGDYLSPSPEVAFEGFDEISGLGARLRVPDRQFSKYQDIAFVSGHFGYDFAKSLMPGRYSFTFLRNPIERILSFYYFCKTQDPKQYEIYALVQKLTLEQFLMLGLERPEIQSFIWNHQTLQLADGWGSSNTRKLLCFSPEEILDLAIRHLDDFSYIGFAETFEEDRDHILKALGIAPPKNKIVSNANSGRPTARDLPATTLNLLDELTHMDKALYKAAWQRKESFNLCDEPTHMEGKLYEVAWQRKVFFEKYFKRWLRFK